MLEPLWWHWIVGGIALVLLELAVPAFFVIWFGLGALLVGVLLLIAPGLSLTTQLIVWTLASIGMTLLWFKVFRNTQRGTRAGQADSVIGEVGLLVTAVAPFQPGQVRFQKPLLGAELWECRTDADIAAGERVKVLAVEGSYVQVAKLH